MWTASIASALLLAMPPADGPGSTIEVDAARPIHRVSPLLHGACLEDVNHEVYGGIYSQMVFGESFQEPPPGPSYKGFSAFGGRWDSAGPGAIRAEAGDGPKLVLDGPGFLEGEASVEVSFDEDRPGNAGLIVRVADPAKGADAFDGYEVSLETRGRLVLGRHRRDWKPIREVACDVPVGRWVDLTVRLKGPAAIEVLVDGRSLLTYEDLDRPLGPGRVGLRTWQRPARFRNLRVVAGGESRPIPFEADPGSAMASGVSGPWRGFTRGDARGSASIEVDRPFKGAQGQKITFEGSAPGEVGVENRGLNRWGMNFQEGKPYEGTVWARLAAPGARPEALTMALEAGDGRRVLASETRRVEGSDWARLDFRLAPTASDPAGRLAIKLNGPGSVVLGYASLQPGEWGRFAGLPVRLDVAEAIRDQGISVLRYGGLMANHPEYRWKNMIGPRDLRPPSAGYWYPQSSNGWGIFDMLNLAEALGIVGVPDLNMGETPDDVADFIRYANAPVATEWGRRRAADGHPAPYRIKLVELGNEEKVDDAYFARFRPIAEALWAADPEAIPVVGDFAYAGVIDDPDHFRGGAGVNSLAAHRKILELARRHGREVWFDIHIGTDHPPEPNGLAPERSYLDQLARLAPGAKFKVAIFEYNSGNHAMKRALSNALATVAVERIGDPIAVACVANALQPDGQNDNGWDQGLVFLNPTRVWLQPPAFLARMARQSYQPILVHSEANGPDASALAQTAKRSDDGKSLTLMVVNPGDDARPVRIKVDGFVPSALSASVDELAGPLDAANTAEAPDRIKPAHFDWAFERLDGPGAPYTFSPRSITFFRFR